mgnify:FL=1
MCKTYTAIYKLAQHTESDILICTLANSKVEGKLHHCNCDFHHDKCYEDIITLKDATVTCLKTKETCEFKWINIPTKHILMFAFKCCEKTDS